jgi:hypothetical protein
MLDQFATRNPGAGQDSSSRLGVGTAVQLRLRVALGLQALPRCSPESFRGRARGGTVAAHHFADVAQQRQQSRSDRDKLPGIVPHESASLSVGPTMLP